MSLDQKQFKNLIVTPTLKLIGLQGESEDNLIVGTGINESRLTYLKQSFGPAIGIMQIEPATYADLRLRLIKHNPELARKVSLALNIASPLYIPELPEYLTGNLCASVIFARLKYYFDPEPLPAFDDYKNLAAYYKRIYNTAKGDADISIAQNIFKSVIMGYPYKG